MNSKRITLSMIILSLFVMTGCASNNELRAVQEKQRQQLNQLERVEQKLKAQERAIQVANQKTNKLLVDQATMKEQENKRYVIKENDTLYSIAKEYNMTVDTLTRLNPQISNPKRLLIGSIINVK